MSDRMILADPASDNTWVDRSSLVQMCKAFLAVELPESNVVPLEEFQEFLPLFKISEIQNANPSELKGLSSRFMQTFSIRHHIKVYSPAETTAGDPEGVYVKRDDKYHKVVYNLLPMVRQLRTLNEIGVGLVNKALKEKDPKVRQKILKAKRDLDNLTTCLMNTSANESPINMQETRYARTIGQFMSAVNPRAEQKKDAAKFREEEKKFLENQKEEVVVPPSQPPSGSSPQSTPSAPSSPSNKKREDASSMMGLFEW